MAERIAGVKRVTVGADKTYNTREPDTSLARIVVVLIFLSFWMYLAGDAEAPAL
jgi:hypothetical protein